MKHFLFFPLPAGSKRFTLVAGLLVLLFSVVGMENQCAAEALSFGEEKEILVVDIGSDLLFALGEYHELTEEEKQKSAFVQDQLVPVIERIISGFRHELQNYQTLAARAGQPVDGVWTDKINSHITTFESELMVREKALEFEMLRHMQRRMLLKTGQ